MSHVSESYYKFAQQLLMISEFDFSAVSRIVFFSYFFLVPVDMCATAGADRLICTVLQARIRIPPEVPTAVLFFSCSGIRVVRRNTECAKITFWFPGSLLYLLDCPETAEKVHFDRRDDAGLPRRHRSK